ncbi:hypothetical protein [Oceanobacillus sp. Castelsardo]|uniref:hypothetical protein n=1 Tax=Oceanobacillus sp. Castelsardo TaxID=1851204 RepID=UPI000838D887|nr:hypothetical protein [Oceanobacillus sp. Castelsardo]
MKNKSWFTWPRVFAFLAFIFLLITIYGNWLEHKDFMEEARNNIVEVNVIQKVAVVNLLEGPGFSIQIEAIPESRVPTKYNSSMIRVSQEFFERAETGDSIAGFEVNGEFYLESHLEDEVRIFYMLLAIFSLYPAGYILYWIMKIKSVRERFGKLAEVLHLEKIGNFVITFVIFGGILATILFFSFTELKDALENGYERFFGDKHAEANALILEKNVDLNSSLHGDHEYYISLMYQPANQDESIYIAKGVTWPTYNRYTDTISIMYNADNPYQVFVKEMTFWDIVEIIMTDTVLMGIIAVLLVILLSLIPYFLWRKKKYGHY